MEQSEIPRELLFSYSVDAMLTIIMSSIKMVNQHYERIKAPLEFLIVPLELL